ncbi:hypothetical protein [Lysinibacillus sp. G4S2]|uniref:hypothetical protein n=1 Tax=Lysinibacillus sp. G4S2 TaxID=3055859 RepID=UPI0025A087A3|nr:hypothetical protein [Lysinibacillus sp. G4S2]MDM5249581.1 hypothetical protein [Lysinibacillus sp. G4S2]
MFSVAKAQRQQQMFICAKAQRQPQLRQGEIDQNERRRVQLLIYKTNYTDH